MKSGWIPTVAGTAAVVSFFLVSGVAAQAQAPAARQQMSEQVFKNVTVLKGIPVDEFMNTMGFISAATNYNCIDCHSSAKVEGDWSVYADETPRKATARRMILMVQELNKNSFNGNRVVTCYTCHRNQQGAPKTVPSLTDQYGTPPDPDPNEVEVRRAASGAPTADQVFDKFLQAVGGAQKAAALTSVVFKGSYQGYAEPLAPVDIYAKAPNQRAMFVHTDGGDRTTTFNGANGPNGSGWMAAPPADKPFPLITFSGGDLEGARLDALLTFPASIKQIVTRPLVGNASIDDNDMNLVQGTVNGGRSPIKLYFDKESGLLVRLLRYSDTMIGRVPVQVDYKDYRDVSGVKLPFHVITTWTDGRSDVTLTSAQANVAIDATRFNQPARSVPPTR